MKKSIILVEDEALIALAQAETIRGFGFEVIIADSGEKGVQIALGEEAVSLILMDIDLGKGIDGTEAARRILERRSLPIVFLTSHSEREMVEKVRGLTRYGYVIKNSGDFVLQSSIEMAFELFDANRKLTKELAERKEAENTLLEMKARIGSQELNSVLVEKASDGFWLLDKAFLTVYVNPAMEEMLGYAKEEMIGRSWYDFGDPEWVARAKELEKRRESGIKEPHPFLFLHKDGRKILARIATTPLYDTAGGFEGALGILSNITRQKEAEDALKIKDMLNAIAKSAGIGMCIINPDYTIVWYNDLYVEWFGGLEQTGGRNCFEVFEGRESICLECPSRVSFTSGKVAVAERAGITTTAGRDRTFFVTASPIRDADGNVLQVVEITQDITDRKKAEEKIQIAKHELEFALKASGAGVWHWDVIQQQLYWSREFYVLFGLDPDSDEASFENWNRVLHPDDRQEAADRLEHAITNNIRLVNDYRIIGPDGQVRWIRALGETVYDAEGKPSWMTGFCVDTTERRQSEAEYEAIIQTTLDGFWINGAGGELLEVNEAYCRMTGYSREELLSMRIAQLEANEDVEETARHMRQVMATRCGLFETRHRRKDGAIIDVEVSCMYREVSGGRFIVFLRDITSRKQGEESLRSLTRLLGSVLGHTHMMTVYLDRHFNFIWVNAAYAATCKQDPSFFPGKNHFDLYPHDENKAIFQHVVDTGEPYVVAAKPFEFADQPERGITYWDWSLVPVKDSQGTVIGLVFTLAEVTERVRAESQKEEALEALLQSEDRFRSAFQHSPIGMAMISPEGKWLKVNPRVCTITGYSEDELMTKTFHDITYPADLDLDLHYVRQMLSGEIESYTMEKRYFHKEGSLVWVLLAVALVRNTAGTPQYFVSQIEDITQRKRAEEALIESETKFRTMFDQSPVGSVVVGLDRRFVRCNAAFCSFLGYPEQELIGKTISEVTYPDDDELGMKELKQIVDRKIESFTLEKRYVRKDGRIVCGEVSICLVRDATGNPSFFLPVIQDTTVRKEAEAKIRNLLAEKELLLHEVHHRIKNNMGTVMGMLSLQAGTLRDTGSAAALNDARRRLQSMMVLYDKLYRSEGVKALSVKEYLVPLIHEIAGNFPNREQVRFEIQVEDVVFDAKKLSTIGIILNELLANAMKHAFVGRDSGTIRVSVTVKEKRAAIAVQDDGGGLPASFDIVTSGGFGLRLVQMLAEQLRGSIRVERGEGTAFILECDA